MSDEAAWRWGRHSAERLFRYYGVKRSRRKGASSLPAAEVQNPLSGSIYTVLGWIPGSCRSKLPVSPASGGLVEGN